MNPCERATANFKSPLEAVQRKIGSQRATYLSTPITSGWRFVEWYKSVGRRLKGRPDYAEAHRRDVIDVNSSHAAAVIEKLRLQEYPKPILEPISFSMPAWSQDDYRCFWGKAIERFVDRAFFLDGWEASYGCVYEFTVAAQEGIPVFDERHRLVDTKEALRLIESAIKAMEVLQLDVDLLKSASESLRAIKSTGRK